MAEFERQGTQKKEPSLPAPGRLRAMSRAGHVTEVDILSPRFISEGNFGVVYETTARTVGVAPVPGAEPPFDTRRRAHEFPAIVKVFKDPDDAARAHLFYDICTDAGLRTMPTYRVDTKQGVAIMTELNRDDKIALSGNNWNLRAGDIHIRRIQNWDEVLQRFFDEASKAADHEIELQEDVYFFTIPTDTDTPVLDFYAGDFDAIRHPVSADGGGLLRRNVLYLRTTAEKFVNKYVPPEARHEHLLAIDTVCAPLLPPHARRLSDV